RFRSDLYYRLAVVCVTMPPLRERRDDIPLLAAHFARDVSGGGGAPGWARAESLERAFAALSGHDWPGNVRQLRNVVERVHILAESALVEGAAADAELELRRTVEQSMSGRLSMRAAREQHERQYLERILHATGWDLDQTSAIAGVHRKSLERLIRKHRLRS